MLAKYKCFAVNIERSDAVKLASELCVQQLQAGCRCYMELDVGRFVL